MATKVMLVDDHALFRKGLAVLVGLGNCFNVVAEAGNGAEAVEVYAQTRPDIVLMDLGLPDMDGVEVTRQILRLDPAARIIMLSALDFDENVTRSVQAGARGFLPKDVDPDALILSLKTVMAGGVALNAAQLRSVIEAGMAVGDDPFDASSAPCGTHAQEGWGTHLSEREHQVLELVAAGLTNKELSERLCISPSTAKAHVANIMAKLGLHSRVELTAYMLSHEAAEGE